MTRIRPLWYLCILVAFAAWIPVSYFRGALLQERAALAEYVAAAEQASALAMAATREQERQWRNHLEKVQIDAKTQIAALDAALSRSDRAASELREKLNAISERPAGYPTPAAGSEATPELLAALLGRLDELAGEFAEAADRNRIAGAACESAYDNLREKGAGRAEQYKR